MKMVEIDAAQMRKAFRRRGLTDKQVATGIYRTPRWLSAARKRGTISEEDARLIRQTFGIHLLEYRRLD